MSDATVLAGPAFVERRDGTLWKRFCVEDGGGAIYCERGEAYVRSRLPLVRWITSERIKRKIVKGIPEMSSKRSVDDERIKRIRKMHDSGVSRTAIAEALSLSATVVGKVISKTGAYAD